MLSKQYHHDVCRLLVFLAVCDLVYMLRYVLYMMYMLYTLYILSSVFIFSVPVLVPRLATSRAFCHLITFLLPLAHLSLSGRWPCYRRTKQYSTVQYSTVQCPGSILLTICLSLERFITVCFPYFKLVHRCVVSCCYQN